MRAIASASGKSPMLRRRDGPLYSPWPIYDRVESAHLIYRRRSKLSRSSNKALSHATVRTRIYAYLSYRPSLVPFPPDILLVIRYDTVRLFVLFSSFSLAIVHLSILFLQLMRASVSLCGTVRPRRVLRVVTATTHRKGPSIIQSQIFLFNDIGWLILMHCVRLMRVISCVCVHVIFVRKCLCVDRDAGFCSAR